MTICEKCWQESFSVDDYRELVESRNDDPCTPEEQAGLDASKCPTCKRWALHQHTRECMNGCQVDSGDENKE